MVRRKIARIAPNKFCRAFGHVNTVARGQLESGKIQRPNFELEKKLPAVEIFPNDMHNQIEEEKACTDAPSSDRTHPASFAQWPSGFDAAVLAFPAPILSKPTDKKTSFTDFGADTSNFGWHSGRASC